MRLTDYHSQSAETEHYFSRDEEKDISEIGEWLLKVACLKADMPPKEQNYEKALDSIFKEDEQSGNKRLDELQKQSGCSPCQWWPRMGEPRKERCRLCHPST